MKKKVFFLFPACLIFYEIATYLANDMYLPSLPSVAQDLAVSQDWAQYTLAIWFLGSASMQLFLGPVSDRFGRKKVLLMGTVLFVLSSIGCAITENIMIFLVARFIQGSAVCFVVVAGYASIHELYDGKRAIQILSIMGSVTILAPAFGPLLGALVVEYSTWRLTFWILGVWGLLGFALLGFSMPETRDDSVSLQLKAILCHYKKILFNAAFMRFTLIFCFIIVSFFIWIVESPFIIIETMDKSPLYFGAVQAIIFSTFIIGAQITKHAILHYSANAIVKGGLSIASVGAGLFLIFSHVYVHMVLIVAAMVIVALGSALVFGPLNRMAIESATEPMGQRMAIFSTAVGLFAGAGSILVTLFNDKTFANLSMMIFACVAIATIIFFRHAQEVVLKDKF